MLGDHRRTDNQTDVMHHGTWRTTGLPGFVTVLLLVVYNRRNHIESIERFKTVRQPHLQCVLDVSQKGSALRAHGPDIAH